MAKSNKQLNTPMAVNWRESERAIWKPKEGRELSIDMAKQKLRQLQADCEGVYMQLQLVYALLDAPEDLPGEGGADGSKTS